MNTGPIPSYSVGLPAAMGKAQAAEEAPQRVAERQAATDTAQAQSATADLARRNADSQILSQLVAPAVSNPAIAQNPQWQKTIASKLKDLGLTLPTIQPGQPGWTPQGAVDVKQLQELTSIKPNADAQALQYLQTLPPGEARNAAASAYSPSSITPQILNSPLVPDQKMKDAFSTEFDKMMLQAEQGNVTPAAFIAWAKSRQSMLPYIGTNFEQVNNSDLVVAGLGAKTKADIQKLIDTGVLNRAKAAAAVEDISKAKSVEQINAARAKYLGQQGVALNEREQIAWMNAQSNRTKADAYSADVSQRIANATNGSWADRQKLLQSDVAEVIRQRASAAGDARSLQATIERAKADGEDVTESVNGGPSLLDALTEAQTRVRAFDNTLSQIKGPVVTANAARGQLNAVGGAGVTNTPENAKPPVDWSKALQSKKNPNLYLDPSTNAIWDKSANPPRYVGQAQ